MSENDRAHNFLLAHGFEKLDFVALSKNMLSDMRNGLCGKKADEDMILTHIDPTEICVCEKSVIVLDAGGTNFRSCVVSFDSTGKATISDFEKTAMPGTSGALSKSAFFSKIAENVFRLRGRANEICFCFSYPMRIEDDGDGVLLGFSKEINAPEVVGSKIGFELKNTLVQNGWDKSLRVHLLNDTVSALLFGSSRGKYVSYIGFILGTGMNCAYVQQAGEFCQKKQIVVCESGKFSALPCSLFDEMLDAKSAKPGSSLIEKQCAGAYLSSLALIIIKTAADEGLFSKENCEKITKIKSLDLKTVSDFLESKSAEFFDIEGEDDRSILFSLFDSVVDRSARICAAIIGAALEQCGSSSEKNPVCVSCNGTTFFKTYKIASRTKKYLSELLSSQQIYFKILDEEADITIGTAMVAFR